MEETKTNTTDLFFYFSGKLLDAPAFILATTHKHSCGYSIKSCDVFCRDSCSCGGHYVSRFQNPPDRRRHETDFLRYSCIVNCCRCLGRGRRVRRRSECRVKLFACHILGSQFQSHAIYHLPIVCRISHSRLYATQSYKTLGKGFEPLLPLRITSSLVLPFSQKADSRLAH